MFLGNSIGHPLRATGLLLTGIILLTSLARAKSIHASNDPVKEEPPITQDERQHWAFRPLFTPSVPAVAHTELVRNDIDRFILAKLEPKSLQFAAPADPVTLIRRVTFDLTGLPPTPEQVKSFANACRIYEAARHQPGGEALRDPYERLVDELLQSPRYGEKWAQGWLDLARYADSDGFEKDRERKEAWKFRDWIVNALNQDLSFDDFVAFQIAGDEISPQNSAATAFLLAGPDTPDSNMQGERRFLLLNEMTATFGSAFLGLSIGCAQCHDHPFDPVSQADYYRLRAFFDNLPQLKKDTQLSITMAEAGVKPPVSHVYVRGDYERPGPAVSAAFLRIANPADMEPYIIATKNSSGRRTTLARWLTQPTNGLFLRSTVNRIWGQHFGQPLAGTPNDLGLQGDAPTHVELIDWLATELPKLHWSLKALHKLIVTSTTYRQSSRGAASDAGQPTFERFIAKEGDTNDAMLSHFPRYRLTGEEIRDAMLFISGRLNLTTGGPGFHLPLPGDPPISKTKRAATVIDPTQTDRRSIFMFAKRNERFPMFDLFDRPEAILSCSRRSETTTAPQALHLFNSAFSLSIAEYLAAEGLEQSRDTSQLVTSAIWRCYSRPPTPAELELGKAFLKRHRASTATDLEDIADYCLALINANAFCFVD